jgi:hypothetical protein
MCVTEPVTHAQRAQMALAGGNQKFADEVCEWNEVAALT